MKPTGLTITASPQHNESKLFICPLSSSFREILFIAQSGTGHGQLIQKSSNIHTRQYPTNECCLLGNIFYLCIVFREISCQTYILKVFSHCPFKKMWKFSTNQRTQRTTLILVIDKARCAPMGMPVRHIYTSVGYCIVYFDSGLSTTFLKIDETAPHFLFIHINHSWSWSGNSSLWI